MSESTESKKPGHLKGWIAPLLMGVIAIAGIAWLAGTLEPQHFKTGKDRELWFAHANDIYADLKKVGIDNQPRPTVESVLSETEARVVLHFTLAEATTDDHTKYVDLTVPVRKLDANGQRQWVVGCQVGDEFVTWDKKLYDGTLVGDFVLTRHACPSAHLLKA